MPIDSTSHVLLSALGGGFFAALFSDYFQSVRRIADKRHDKYFDHRNTIVQIEHELIPVRINIGRNLESTKISIKDSTDNRVRILLRLYKLIMSPGLSLRLLDLNFINKYSQLHVLFETINTDIDYINGLVETIKSDYKQKNVDPNLLSTYLIFVKELDKKLKKADKDSLELLTMAKLTIRKDDKNILEEYKELGGNIKYKFSKKRIEEENKLTEKEEKRKPRGEEKQEKFVAPYFDLIKVIIPSPQTTI